MQKHSVHATLQDISTNSYYVHIYYSFIAENFSSPIRNNNSYILTSFYLLRHYLRHLLRHTLCYKIFHVPFLFEPNLSIIPFSFISFNNRCTCLSDISNFSAAPFAEIFLSFSNICNSLS